jgi:hypothetical protein
LRPHTVGQEIEHALRAAAQIYCACAWQNVELIEQPIGLARKFLYLHSQALFFRTAPPEKINIWCRHSAPTALDLSPLSQPGTFWQLGIRLQKNV